MKFITKTVSVITLVIATFFCASTSQSQAPTFMMYQGKVGDIWTREWGLHVTIDQPTGATAFASATCLGITLNSRTSPILLAEIANYKTMRDALFLAQATDRSVRIFVYIDPATGCTGAHPKMFAVDLLKT